MSAVAFVVLLAVLLATIVSLVVRARRSRGAERQQFKWLGAGGLFLVGSIALGIVVDALHLQLPQAFGNLVFVLGVSAIPLAIGVAVLRYRLYDIDALINRALVYAVLTATLGAVYLAMVLAMQGVLGAVTPDTANNGVAVAASTLAAAALFQPARRRIQGFIDRRFYRRKYHAARTVEAFASRLRDEVDLETLSSDLVRVVGETMQPARVSLWLRPTRSA